MPGEPDPGQPLTALTTEPSGSRDACKQTHARFGRGAHVIADRLFIITLRENQWVGVNSVQSCGGPGASGLGGVTSRWLIENGG